MSRAVILAGGPHHGTVLETNHRHLTLFANPEPADLATQAMSPITQADCPAFTYRIDQFRILGRIIYVGRLDNTTDTEVLEAILNPKVLAGSVRA